MDGAYSPISVMAGNDPPSPIDKASLCRREMADQVRHDRVVLKAVLELFCHSYGQATFVVFL